MLAGQPPGADRAGLADAEVERVAVRVARAHEERRGASVTTVEADGVGFDLLSILVLSGGASR
jgi:hypothetical protein